jgi:hypothetical protein
LASLAAHKSGAVYLNIALFCYLVSEVLHEREFGFWKKWDRFLLADSPIGKMRIGNREVVPQTA